MGLYPLNIYLWVPGYPTKYPFGFLANKLPGYGSCSYHWYSEVPSQPGSGTAWWTSPSRRSWPFIFQAHRPRAGSGAV